MFKIIFIISLTFAFAGCANDCQSAKDDVQKYANIYLNALLQGHKGASVEGGSEAISALQIAQKKCNDPNLKIEDFFKK
jgi:hypothetical protein